MRVFLLLPLLAALAACAPDKVAPVPVMAMVLSNTGQYEPREVALTTISDVVALRGTAARLIGGARLVDNDQDPLRASVTTEEQLRQAIIKTEGLPPRASYVERGGVLWPADFHTWNMVTTYLNFESAFLYFQDIGYTTAENLDPQTGFGATVYYFPEYTFGFAAQPMRDNALFSPPVKAFAVLPFQELQTIPLSMNSGVVAHEFSHRVFNLRVFGGASIPLPYSEEWVGSFSSPGSNVAKGLDEGLADYHAYGASCATSYGCSTRFLEASLGAFAADERDFGPQTERCMDVQLRNAINTMHFGAFASGGQDYRLGTLLAHALHKAAGSTKRQTMQSALLAAYDDQGAAPGFRQLVEANAGTPGGFTLQAVAISILQHIPDPDLKVETCNAFIDHLQIPKEFLTAPAGAPLACPAESINPGTCPNING